jgi:hypothetical protein
MDPPEGDQAKLTKCEYEWIAAAFEEVRKTIAKYELFKTEVYEKPPRPGCTGAKNILEDIKTKLKTALTEASAEGVMAGAWNASLRHGGETGCVRIVFLLGRKKKRGSRECETLAKLEIVEVLS